MPEKNGLSEILVCLIEYIRKGSSGESLVSQPKETENEETKTEDFKYKLLELKYRLLELRLKQKHALIITIIKGIIILTAICLIGYFNLGSSIPTALQLALLLGIKGPEQ